MRADARWSATNPIWNAHLSAFITFVDWKQWATDQLTTNELWFAKVFEKVARSTNKIRPFFEDFCRWVFLPQVLAAEGGYMPTEEVVQLSKFVDVVTKFGMFWDCCDGESANEGPGVNWKFVGIPWFVLSFFNSPWMKQVGEMRNQILVKFYSELLWNAMHITSVWHSILASGSMKFFEGDYPRIWAICATKKTQSENEKAALRTFIQSEELFIHFRHFLNSFTLPIPTRTGICRTGFLLLAIFCQDSEK